MAKIREIQEDDLSAIVALLSEGFPRKSKAYWEHAVAVLTERPRCGKLPAYGLLLEIEGALQGVMLMIAGQREGRFYCNLSSWYVRSDHRNYSALLFQRALRHKDVCFTDCSPAEHVLPIITKFGFRPYSGGTVLIDVRACIRQSGDTVRELNTDALKMLDSIQRSTMEENLLFGCRGFIITGPEHDARPVLYRTTRLKKLIPAARFVFGNPVMLLQNAGGLARGLLKRGVPVMLIDLPADMSPPFGKAIAGYGVRHARGGPPPATGDLLDTEIALFGF